MVYPVYRKNSIGNSVYKIETDTKFIEKQRIGSNILIHEVEAKQYPEMLLINEMIECKPNTFEEISEEEWEGFGE
ncbi:MAG: hypothetical protein R2799_11615 [Crocinitomicaceae bacterium]